VRVLHKSAYALCALLFVVTSACMHLYKLALMSDFIMLTLELSSVVTATSVLLFELHSIHSAIRVFNAAVTHKDGDGMVSAADLATITSADFQVQSIHSNNS
jgi:hypothetical protein